MGFDILQMLIVLVILLLLVRPVGPYLAPVFPRSARYSSNGGPWTSP